LAASLLPQTFVAVFQHLYLMDVVVVDVFPPPHTIYLLRNLVVNTHNACIIPVVVPALTVYTLDVVENIVGCTVLIVPEDGQHVGRL
jgi:hypothetical protein